MYVCIYIYVCVCVYHIYIYTFQQMQCHHENYNSHILLLDIMRLDAWLVAVYKKLQVITIID